MIKNALPTLLLLLTATCLEAERFDFYADGEVLATLEFSQMPATLDDFVSLSFTELGEDIFGFGPVYTGSFDIMPSQGSRPRFIISDFDGGLGAIDNDGVESIGMEDLNPPPSETFNIKSFFIAAADTPDRLGLTFSNVPPATGSTIFTQEGQFLLVPEPSSHIILASVLGIVGFMRRQQRV